MIFLVFIGLIYFLCVIRILLDLFCDLRVKLGFVGSEYEFREWN